MKGKFHIRNQDLERDSGLVDALREIPLKVSVDLYHGAQMPEGEINYAVDSDLAGDDNLLTYEVQTVNTGELRQNISTIYNDRSEEITYVDSSSSNIALRFRKRVFVFHYEPVSREDASLEGRTLHYLDGSRVPLLEQLEVKQDDE